jgi:putative restriction endonuclease
MIEEGSTVSQIDQVPAGAASVLVTRIEALEATVRRTFELSRSLPTAPLDRFANETRNMPTTTEAERLVVQRVGQNIFREALLDLWSGALRRDWVVPA